MIRNLLTCPPQPCHSQLEAAPCKMVILPWGPPALLAFPSAVISTHLINSNVVCQRGEVHQLDSSLQAEHGLMPQVVPRRSIRLPVRLPLLYLPLCPRKQLKASLQDSHVMSPSMREHTFDIGRVSSSNTLTMQPMCDSFLVGNRTLAC